MARGRRVACVIRSLVNTRSLQLKYAKVLHESLLVPILTHDSERRILREKEKSRSRAVQMDNLKGLLGIKRMDKVLNSWIKQLFRVTKGVDENIDGYPMVRTYGEDGEQQHC